MKVQHLGSNPLNQQEEDKERIKSPIIETFQSLAKQTFACECGKEYLSFPALYVHARIKHNLKLSCKQKKQTFQTLMCPGQIKKTFSLKNGKENEFEYIEKQRIQTINLQKKPQMSVLDLRNQLLLEQLFLNFKNQKQISSQNDILLIHFAKIVIKHLCKNQKLNISDLPNFFNTYLVYYLPQHSRQEISTQKWRSSCQFFYAFYRWLYENQFTRLILIPEFIGSLCQ